MGEVGFTPPAGWRTSTDGMSELIRQTDWSTTPLGPRAGWSASLQLALDIVLASAHPMALRWGPEFVLVYNDAYRTILGDKHPWALGRPIQEAWAEVWEQIRPAHEAILNGATRSIFAEDIVLRIRRRAGQWEDAHFTLGYSAVKDPSAPTGVGGILVTAVDISERTRVADALRENRSFLKDILKSSGEGFYAVDREGTTTLCNQAFLRSLGFEREEDAVGRKLHDVIHHTHPDGSHYDKSDCPIYICASSGKSAHVEEEYFYRLNGQAFPVEYWVSPIIREGTHQGAICTFVDITARKAAEAKIAHSEAQFRTFAQAMPNHVWAATPDGKLDWFNERVYAYSGLLPSVLAGDGWVEMVHPDDRAEAGARWALALQSGETYQMEFRLRRFDGKYRWHLARAIAIRGAQDQIERWIGTNTDIDDERQTSRALTALNTTLEQRVAEQSAERDRLWQTSQDLLVVVGPDGTFKAANPAWTSILGWHPHEVIGKHHLEFVHPGDRTGSQGGAR